MLSGYMCRIILLLAGYGLIAIPVGAQKTAVLRGSVAYFDSIDHRIKYLENQISLYKQKKDVMYLNYQRELDHTLFIKSYEEFVLDEDLEKAKALISGRIERSEFRRDMASVKFYRTYEEDVYALIKQQRMHYQELFQKQKNFKNKFDAVIKPATLESFNKAKRMVQLALKYAEENNLAETVQYLKLYDSYSDALIFDAGSDYDLAELTNNAKSFEKVFLPLASSDSVEGIKEAERLLSYCINYGRLSGSSLNGEYFKKQEMILTSSLTELLEKQGREKDLARYTDQSVVAKYDTLNPCGVFKWHDQVIVIDEFKPTSSMENVKKGEAIIHADRMLATYLEKNKLCQSVSDLKFGYSFIIPYKSNAKNTSFYYNKASQKWQYIACYTIIVSQSYTAQVSKFMPPIYFEDEMNVAER